jgi:hypothetical protein
METLGVAQLAVLNQVGVGEKYIDADKLRNDFSKLFPFLFPSNNWNVQISCSAEEEYLGARRKTERNELYASPTLF